MCDMSKKPPVFMLSTRNGVQNLGPSRPRVVSDAVTGGLLSSVDVSGPSATATGAGGVPTSGWALNSPQTSFPSVRLKAKFAGGGGSGAEGYFVTNSSGVITSIVITAQGSGYSGTVTATPMRSNTADIVFDLGEDWRQYATAAILCTGFGTDAIARVAAYVGDADMPTTMTLCNPRNSSTGPTEAFIQPLSGASPGALIYLGGRRVRLNVIVGMDVPEGARVDLVCYPS